MSKKKIIIADEETESRLAMSGYFNKLGCEVIGTRDGQEVLSVIQHQDIDVLIASQELPKVDVLQLLRTVRQEKPGVAVVIVAQVPSVETAVAAMKEQAVDYLEKPVVLAELQQVLATVITELGAVAPGTDAAQPAADEQSGAFENIIGESAPMAKVFGLIEKVADETSTVIIYGESGTGKELVARALHYHSSRAPQPLIPVNCGAIPEELLESELFGHEKGAFTGAHRARVGRFELADGGTIFLDEIGDMSPNLQVKILRVLQEHEFERVGGVRPHRVDVRVIAATHRNLEQYVADGKFREDLYYRLNVIPITMPPLRERKTDIPQLASHFIAKFNSAKNKQITGISRDALECFVAYDWPGNVRELQNMIERLVILKGAGEIDLEDMPEKLLAGRSAGAPAGVELSEAGVSFTTMVTGYEKQLILQALQRTSGVKNKAAKLLSMNRTTLVEKMKKLQISYNDDT